MFECAPRGRANVLIMNPRSSVEGSTGLFAKPVFPLCHILSTSAGMFLPTDVAPPISDAEPPVSLVGAFVTAPLRSLSLRHGPDGPVLLAPLWPSKGLPLANSSHLPT